MTVQYQEEDINGQPSPLSLTITVPTVPIVAAAPPNDAAIFFPSGAADAVIVGTGISVTGTAATGTLFEISKPGLYTASFQAVDGGLTASPFNILRGAIVGTLGPPLYAVPDFVGAPSPGIIGVGETNGPADTPTTPFRVEDTFRIADSDLVDPPGGPVNPLRQIVFVTFGPVIAAMLPPFIKVAINRVSR